MTERMPKIIRYVITAFSVLMILLVLFINSNLASLAELLLPGSILWTHAILLGIEALALFWAWRAVFGGRRRHLLLVSGDSPEDWERFAKELACRMRDNPHILQAGIAPPSSGEDNKEYLARCLSVLNAKADEEIQQNAKRIFLATALSQNGKIDALIMLVSLCRMIWRVSSIYNQKPHPREIVSLYGAVVSSTFLALSIEEFDLSTEITVGFGEAFQAMLPAGFAASLPFAGKVLHTFTASTIDGAANCYLGLRAGIITRNAYAYALHQEERPGRPAVFKEAGALLLGMSQTLVNKLAATVADGVLGAVGSVGKKTVQSGKDVVGGLGEAAGKLGSGTVSAVQSTGSGLAFLGKQAVSTVSQAGKQTVQAGKSVADGVGKVGAGIGNVAEKLGSGTVNAVQSAGSGLAEIGRQTAAVAGQAGKQAAQAGKSVADGVGKVGAGIGNVAEKLGSGTVNAVQSAGSGLAALKKSVGKTASRTANLLRSPFRRP